jgi:hypothetical protein
VKDSLEGMIRKEEINKEYVDRKLNKKKNLSSLIE